MMIAMKMLRKKWMDLIMNRRKKDTTMIMRMKTRNKTQIRRERWMVMNKMTKIVGIKLQKQNKMTMMNQ